MDRQRIKEKQAQSEAEGRERALAALKLKRQQASAVIHQVAKAQLQAYHRAKDNARVHAHRLLHPPVPPGMVMCARSRPASYTVFTAQPDSGYMPVHHQYDELGPLGVQLASKIFSAIDDDRSSAGDAAARTRMLAALKPSAPKHAQLSSPNKPTSSTAEISSATAAPDQRATPIMKTSPDDASGTQSGSVRPASAAKADSATSPASSKGGLSDLGLGFDFAAELSSAIAQETEKTMEEAKVRHQKDREAEAAAAAFNKELFSALDEGLGDIKQAVREADTIAASRNKAKVLGDRIPLIEPVQTVMTWEEFEEEQRDIIGQPKKRIRQEDEEGRNFSTAVRRIPFKREWEDGLQWPSATMIDLLKLELDYVAEEAEDARQTKERNRTYSRRAIIVHDDIELIAYGMHV